MTPNSPNCTKCGAPLNGDKCDYCGAVYTRKKNTQPVNAATKVVDVDPDDEASIIASLNLKLDTSKPDVYNKDADAGFSGVDVFLFVAWCIVFAFIFFGSHLYKLPVIYTPAVFLAPIAAFQLLVAFFGLINYGVIKSASPARSNKLRHYTTRAVIWIILGVPIAYNVNNWRKHPPYVEVIKQDVVLGMKPGDSVFVSAYQLKSASDIPIEYFIRPVNKSDIEKMNIPNYEKKQKIYRLDTSDFGHNDIYGYIRVKQVFKNNSGYIGKFVSSNGAANYQDPDEINSEYVEVDVDAKKLNIDADVSPAPEGYVNTKRLFIQRKFLSAKDSLKFIN